jgi:hypothetical protein
VGARELPRPIPPGRVRAGRWRRACGPGVAHGRVIDDDVITSALAGAGGQSAHTRPSTSPDLLGRSGRFPTAAIEIIGLPMPSALATWLRLVIKRRSPPRFLHC